MLLERALKAGSWERALHGRAAWFPVSLCMPCPPSRARPPHLLMCHGSHRGHQGLDTLLKEEWGEVAVSRSAHKRPKPGILTGLFSRIQGLFYPVSFYGESHERQWKGTERSVKKQPMVAGHSGKLEMKVKSLPRFMQKP